MLALRMPKAPPAPEDDDDALLDVMRHDGYHVRKPHPFLLQRGTRTLERGRDFWKPDVPREDKALVGAAVAFLRQDLGEQGATGKLIQRLAAQSRADNVEMLERLRDRLQSEVEVCSGPPPPTAQQNEVDAAAAQRSVDLLKGEMDVVSSLEVDMQRAADMGRELRGSFARLLGEQGSLSKTYEVAVSTLEKAAACPPAQVGAELLSALTSIVSQDQAILKQREASWRAPPNDNGQKERLVLARKGKSDEIKQGQKKLAAAQMRVAAIKKKAPPSTAMPPHGCGGLQKHLDLLDAIRRGLHILQG